MEGGAPLPVAHADLRVQHDEQPHAVRKALVGCPVQRRPAIHVRTARQTTQSGATAKFIQRAFPKPSLPCSLSNGWLYKPKSQTLCAMDK